MPDRRSRVVSWPLLIVGSLLVMGILMVVAWNIELPYLAFSSGPVSDAADAIVAEEVEVFPPEGELLMLTVVSQDVNIFEALIAAIDPTIDLVRREAYRPPGESDEEYRNRVLDQMSDSHRVSIAIALQELGYEMQPTGVLVVGVAEGKAVSQVLAVGDIIDTINGLPVTSLSDISAALNMLDVGDVIELEITREGSVQVVEIELTTRDDTGGPMIGITAQALTEPPFPVSIETGVIGGPSAGMMHTLAIIELLTADELTNGHIVAGTGTVRPDGTIGNIGGVRQKIVGAEAAGADYVLVPAGNYEAALTAERDSIEIVPVADISEALAFFETLPEFSY